MPSQFGDLVALDGESLDEVRSVGVPPAEDDFLLWATPDERLEGDRVASIDQHGLRRRIRGPLEDQLGVTLPGSSTANSVLSNPRLEFRVRESVLEQREAHIPAELLKAWAIPRHDRFGSEHLTQFTLGDVGPHPTRPELESIDLVYET